MQIQQLLLDAFAAMRELLSRLGDAQPVVICIDDAHWMDPDSHQLLHRVLAQPNDSRLLVVAAYRGDAAAAAHTGGTVSVPLDCERQQIELGALTAEETEQLIGAVSQFGVPAEVCAALIRESRGVPFFVGELVQHLAEPSAQTTKDVTGLLNARVRRCSPGAQRLLAVLAVAERPLPLRVAVDAASESHAAAAISGELCKAKLARLSRHHGGELLQVYHARILDALRVGRDPEHAASLHARIADAFATDAGGEPEQELRHRLLAGQRRRAAELAVLAAGKAAQGWAWNRAADLLGTALELCEPPAELRRDWLEQRGAALANSGRCSEAADVYFELERASSGETAQRAALALCQQLLRAGRVSEGMCELRRVYRRHGLYFADLDTKPLPMYLRARLGVYTVRVRTQPSTAVPNPRAQAQLDALEAVISELLSIDPVRARIVHGQLFRLAVHAGDLRRVLVAALLEVIHVGYLDGKRGRARVDRLLKKIAEIADALGTPLARGLQWFSQGVAAFSCWETLDQAQLALRRADAMLDEHLSRRHFVREMLAAYRSWVAEYTGEFDQLAAGGSLNDDNNYADITMPTRVQGVPLSLLLRDRPKCAAAFLDLRTPSDVLPLLDYLRAVRSADVAFYVRDFAYARRVIDELGMRFRSSILHPSPPFRNSFAFYCARNIAQQFFTERRAELRAQVEHLERSTHHRHAPSYNRGFLRLIRAGVAVADAELRAARGWLEAAELDFSAGGAQQGAACARYRLAQLCGTPSAFDEAKQWFLCRGVVDPEKWVSLWAPMPRDGDLA